MRKVLILCLMLFLVLALFPAFAIVATDRSNLFIQPDTEQNIKSTENEKENYSEEIIKLALSLIENDFCDEGIMASLAIAENNFYHNKDNDMKNKQPEQASDTDKVLFDKVKKLYKNVHVKIEYKNEKVYIPAVKLSKGYTEADNDYPYIKAVASPWDCFDEDFVYNKNYSVGISMKGIDYLCKEGLNYKEALKWYLPDFEIN